MKENTPWYIAIGAIVFLAVCGLAFFALFGVGGISSSSSYTRPVVAPEQPYALEGSGTDSNEILEEARDRNVGEPVEWSDPTWQIVAGYYGELPFDLEKAFAMRVEQEAVSFETFESWYDQVEFSWTRDPVDLGDDTFRFLVNLVEEDPFNLTMYSVVMKVENGKVNPISSNELHNYVLSEVSRPEHDGDGAEVYYNDGVEYIYADRNGERLTLVSVDRGTSSEFGGASIFQTIESITFSDSGDYLTVTYGGWEGSLFEVYDFDRGEKVHVTDSPSNWGFAPDNESWFAECQGSGMSSGYIRVYDLPNWTLRYEYPEAFIEDCSINIGQEILFSTMSFGSNGENTEAKWRYDILKNTLLPTE